MWQEFKQNWTDSWKFTGEMFKLMFRRYWLCLMLNVFLVVQLSSWLSRVYDMHYGLTALLILICYALSPLTLLLWLPQYLKQKKPDLYRGIMKSAGDWIGEPYPKH